MNDETDIIEVNADLEEGQAENNEVVEASPENDMELQENETSLEAPSAEDTEKLPPAEAESSAGQKDETEKKDSERDNLLSQIEELKKENLKEKIRSEASQLLKDAGLPVNEKTLTHVCRENLEDTKEAINIAKEIGSYMVNAALSKVMRGRTPSGSSGRMSLGSSHSSNIRDQVRDALK